MGTEATLQLRKFDMSRITKKSVVIMIGKRNTGKSFLVKDLLYYKRDIPLGTVISSTESANQFYGSMIPSTLIYDEYNSEVIHNVMKRQFEVTKKRKQQEARYNTSSIDSYAFLIMDDLMYDTSWLKDPNMRFVFMNGRHLDLLFILTMQYCLGIPPSFRTNVDFVFILRENIISNRRRLYEQFAGMFPTFEIFCQVLDQCTENYGCLVIDNSAQTNKIEDTVFWYHADSHEPFKLCAPEVWQYHSNNYNEGDEVPDDIDINSVRKKNTIVVNVKRNNY
jgi:hypothetical protein